MSGKEHIIEIINERIEVPINKVRIFSMSLSFIVLLVIIGFYIYKTLSDKNLDLVCILCIITFPLFCFLIIKYIMMILNKAPGLIFDNTGIINDNGVVKAGHILWENIIQINISWDNIPGVFIPSTNVIALPTRKCYIMIIINNPDEYIKRQKSIYSRIIAKKNYKICKTPICIQTDTLKCNITELKNIIQEQMEKWMK